MKTPARTLRRSLLLPALMLGLSMPALAQDAAATPAQTITPEAKTFVDFCETRKARDVIARLGSVPTQR